MSFEYKTTPTSQCALTWWELNKSDQTYAWPVYLYFENGMRVGGIGSLFDINLHYTTVCNSNELSSPDIQWPYNNLIDYDQSSGSCFITLEYRAWHGKNSMRQRAAPSVFCPVYSMRQKAAPSVFCPVYIMRQKAAPSVFCPVYSMRQRAAPSVLCPVPLNDMAGDDFRVHLKMHFSRWTFPGEHPWSFVTHLEINKCKSTHRLLSTSPW